jgi:hypothetical protein
MSTLYSFPMEGDVMKTNMTSMAICAILLAGGLAGCDSIGSTKLKPDRYNYSNALGDSWKEQVLLNIVRLRYGDAPVFLDVSQIISGYSIEHQGRVGGQVGENQFLPVWSWNMNGSASVKYTDRPTITYRPLTGAPYVRNLMTPIPPRALLALIEGGFAADLVFRAGVFRINGLRNRAVLGAKLIHADEEFLQLLKIMRELHGEGVLGVRIEKPDKDKPERAVIVLKKGNASKEVLNKIRKACELLKLSPDVTEFPVTSSGVPPTDRTISIQTLSVLRILVNLAAQVDVPAKDIEEGRAWPIAPDQTGNQAQFHVRSGPDAPSDAFTSVRYRDKWFWVSDTDLMSKRALTFMTIVFAISEPHSTAAPTVVTVSAN